MRRILFPLVFAVLVFAACGDDGTPSAGAESDPEEAMLAFAKCMRGEGIDMPDPSSEGGGFIRVQEEGAAGPSNAEIEKMEAAEKKCNHHLEGADLGPQSPEEEAEFREKALGMARCMREHGYDMPDPTFSEGGRVEQRLEGDRIDFEDPEFQSAQKACSDKVGMPTPQGAITRGGRG